MEHASHQAQQFKAQGVGEALPRYKYGQVEKKACTIPEVTTPSSAPLPHHTPPTDLSPTQPFSLHGSMARPVVRMEEEQQHGGGTSHLHPPHLTPWSPHHITTSPPVDISA